MGEEKPTDLIVSAIREDNYNKGNALLPCPFCGGEAIYIHDGPLSYEASCDCCDARMDTYTYEMLLEQWNRRI